MTGQRNQLYGQRNQLYVKQSKHLVQRWFHRWLTTVLQLRQPRPHRKQIIHKLSHQFYLVRTARVNSQKVIFCLELFRTNLVFHSKVSKNLILLIVPKMDYWMVKWILNPVVWKIWIPWCEKPKIGRTRHHSCFWGEFRGRHAKSFTCHANRNYWTLLSVKYIYFIFQIN